MIAFSLPIIAWLASTLQTGVSAAPTWPSSIDDLEDIMLLNTGYRARGFAVAVTPCSFSAQGAGRVAAAEWIRTAFHDMATGNVVLGTGGLDASLVFETNGGENIGAGFNTTLATYAPFLSSRASMADIIAMGIYTATRSCGGPIVPIKAGRIDATEGGNGGVPLPQNAISIFKNQFLRMGFNTTEMIAVTACGHTIGGVHSSNFPEIVPVASAANSNGVKNFDTTQMFDSKIATEYVSGTTLNPLVVGPSIANARNSDKRVFAADGNVTITAMQDPATFASLCSAMFQKMIEVVPPGVVLTDPIAPYEVKPYALQLTLLAGGLSISFTGDIRIRTTTRGASQVASVQLVYKDRDGTAVDENIDTTFKGAALGFDDSFAFYGFSTKLSASSSISSFNVLVTLISGSTELHDNNGAGFAIQDTIMLQSPQSCLSPTNDANGQRSLTVVAAVRDTVASSVQLQLTLKVPRSNGIVVPALSTVSAAMASQSAVGSYNLYAATYSLDPSQTQTTSFGVSVGSSEDNYKNTTLLPSTCADLSPTAPSSTPSSSAFSYQGCYTDSSVSRAFSGAVFYDNSLTVEKCGANCINFQYFGVEYGGECYCGDSRHSSSTRAGASECNVVCPGNTDEYCGGDSRISAYKNLQYSPIINPTITGYTYQGCFSEGQGGRALSGASTAADDLTVESCATFCDGSEYFGVEYGRECYCGTSLATSSTEQSASDCSMTCAGDSQEYCGAGNRLDVYKKTSVSSSASSSTSSSSSTAASSSAATSSVDTSSSSSSTSIPSTSSTTSSSSSATSSSAAAGPTLAGYDYQGCHTDLVYARVLTAKTESTGAMTYASCAAFCSGYNYFGVEYGSECYCGDSFTNPTDTVPETDCSLACSGDATEICGAGNRMNLFKSITQHTGPSNPSIAGYTYASCHTDNVGDRVLDAKYLFDNSMTVETCATFCAGYTYFGTEYGTECYCGNTFAFPSSVVSEGDCSFLCPGNSNEFCGAGNRLSLYQAV